MTLPKGYSSGGRRVDGGNRDEIERMIGRRVENMRWDLRSWIYLMLGCNCWWYIRWCDCISVGLSIT